MDNSFKLMTMLSLLTIYVCYIYSNVNTRIDNINARIDFMSSRVDRTILNNYKVFKEEK